MRYLVGEAMTGGYGDANILHDCTIGVDEGEIAVVVGPNGAGKSTAMKAVFGMLGLRSGRVLMNGEDITALKPQERVRKGMGFVPQTNNVFPSLTVLENLEMGAFVRTDDVDDTLSQVLELFPVLKEKADQPAGELSGGQRQQVAVGRALMTQPKVLMLDEPTAALSPKYQQDILANIDDLRKEGISVLLVEQNARLSLSKSDRGYIFAAGSVVYTGTAKEILNNPNIGDYFLGLQQ